MKILVDRERIVDAIEELTPVLGKHAAINAGISILDQILEESEVVNDALNPNLQKASDEIRAKLNRGTPDPRCDNCMYQHPFVENMIIDELNGAIFCKRNVNLPYLEDGRWVGAFEEGQGLMVCSVYHWSDGGLVRA